MDGVAVEGIAPGVRRGRPDLAAARLQENLRRSVEEVPSGILGRDVAAAEMDAGIVRRQARPAAIGRSAPVVGRDASLAEADRAEGKQVKMAMRAWQENKGTPSAGTNLNRLNPGRQSPPQIRTCRRKYSALFLFRRLLVGCRCPPVGKL